MSSASSGSQPQVYRSEGRWQVQPQVYRSEGPWQAWVFPTVWSPPLFGVGGPAHLAAVLVVLVVVTLTVVTDPVEATKSTSVQED